MGDMNTMVIGDIWGTGGTFARPLAVKLHGNVSELDLETMVELIHATGQNVRFNCYEGYTFYFAGMDRGVLEGFLETLYLFDCNVTLSPIVREGIFT